ncbi:MAG TPA: hypothetical protein VH280_00940 [Verrucomicrobiae bacterium]|nr:hypothetical protein [Verrucomicrobiae bacterium]
MALELHKTVLVFALNFRNGRRSDSRYRAVLQLAAIVWLTLPRAALTDSLARGYIYFTPLGFRFAASPTDKTGSLIPALNGIPEDDDDPPSSGFGAAGDEHENEPQSPA